MKNQQVKVRIIEPHDASQKFHDWWFDPQRPRVRADRRGFSHPNMLTADWFRVRCGNPGCFALAYVHHSVISDAIDEALR